MGLATGTWAPRCTRGRARGGGGGRREGSGDYPWQKPCAYAGSSIRECRSRPVRAPIPMPTLVKGTVIRVHMPFFLFVDAVCSHAQGCREHPSGLTATIPLTVVHEQKLISVPIKVPSVAMAQSHVNWANRCTREPSKPIHWVQNISSVPTRTYLAIAIGISCWASHIQI